MYDRSVYFALLKNYPKLMPKTNCTPVKGVKVIKWKLTEVGILNILNRN